MKLLKLAAVALTAGLVFPSLLKAESASSTYLKCTTTRHDGRPTTFEYTLNEAQQTASQLLVQTGSVSNMKASFGTHFISMSTQVGSFLPETKTITINRANGNYVRTLMGSKWTGTCKKIEPQKRLF